MLSIKVLRLVLKGKFLGVGRERLWKKETFRKQQVRTVLRKLLWWGWGVGVGHGKTLRANPRL